MAVSTSYNADTQKYTVSSSKNKTLNNISAVTKSGNTRTNINTVYTRSSNTAKANGNTVADDYKERSVNDRYQSMQLSLEQQDTVMNEKIRQSQEKYAGLYNDSEQKYIEKLASSNEIIGRDYQSSAIKNPPTYTTQQQIINSRWKSSSNYGNVSSVTRNGMKTGDMDDGGFSNGIAQTALNRTVDPLNKIIGSQGRYMKLKNSTGFSDSIDTSEYFKALFHSAGIWKPKEINPYKYYYRFGAFNPTFTLSNCREYLFFTKPDLNIFPRSNKDGSTGSKMNDYLAAQPFWTEMKEKYPDVLKMLQKSADGTANPFNGLLSYYVQSNLDLPNVQAESIDTPANMYGVNYDYRGSSEASDDSFQFSLEFRDSKYLPVYHFFKAYDDYQTIKHHGYLEPWHKYIANKILYDHFAIFKILVDEDMETIIYYAKLYGVKPMSVPREAFSNTDFANGLSYNIDFKAAFVRDMKPFIITDFNNISKPYYDTLKYQIDVHNPTLDRPDNRPAMGAYIEKVEWHDGEGYNGRNKGAIAATYAPGGFVYKLRWRGNTRL